MQRIRSIGVCPLLAAMVMGIEFSQKAVVQISTAVTTAPVINELEVSFNDSFSEGNNVIWQYEARFNRQTYLVNVKNPQDEWDGDADGIWCDASHEGIQIVDARGLTQDDIDDIEEEVMQVFCLDYKESN